MDTSFFRFLHNLKGKTDHSISNFNLIDYSFTIPGNYPIIDTFPFQIAITYHYTNPIKSTDTHPDGCTKTDPASARD